jgi:beta-xylosidase
MNRQPQEKHQLQSVLHRYCRCHFWFCLTLLWLLVAGQALAQLPVYGDYYAHDPSTMIKDGTNYYIFRTSPGIMGKRSGDLRNWAYTGRVFPGNPPDWVTNAVSGFDPNNWAWAPDIAYFNGRYNLYYAVSSWGTIDSVIGLVTSPSLNSPVWTDQGKVVQSDAVWQATTNTDFTSINCIDPSILVDTNGTIWMSFGSYSDGIMVIQLNPATGKPLGSAATAVKIAGNGATFFSNTTEGSCISQRGGYYYLFLNFGGCCSGVDSTYNIRVGRSLAVTGPYLDESGNSMLNGGGTVLLESTGRFIGPGHAAIMNDNGTNWFTYHYYDGNNGGTPTLGLARLNWSADGWPVLTNDWSAFYTFNTDAREHRGLYNGALQNNAAVTNDPARGAVLSLDGSTNFVSLPLSVGNASTFATWVKWNGGSDWQRIFDFGTSTTNYFFLTPRAYGGKMRFAITTNGNGAEQQINAPDALPTNSWCHVAIALDGVNGLLYLNGNPIATNNALTIRPWQTLARNLYLGKSQFAADPLFNGRIGSFRIFGRALSALEIRDLAYAHPALAHRYSFNTNWLNLAWDSIGMAHGTLWGNAVLANGALVLNGTSGSYVNLPGGLVSGSSAVTLECWATFGTNGNWARLADFGNISGGNGIQYFFYSPHTALGGQRLELRTNTTTTFDIAGTLDNRAVCLACIVDPANSYAAVYTNGVLEQALSNPWPVFSSVSTAWSFIGRSLFSADAWLNATVDEFRIYDGRLTPDEIATDYKFGPDALALPVSLVASNPAAGLTLSWPSWTVGYVLQSSSSLTGGTWTTNGFAPVLANDCWQIVLPLADTAQFYRMRR